MVEPSRSHVGANTHYRVCNVMQAYFWLSDEFHNITWRLQEVGDVSTWLLPEYILQANYLTSLMCWHVLYFKAPRFSPSLPLYKAMLHFILSCNPCNLVSTTTDPIPGNRVPGFRQTYRHTILLSQIKLYRPTHQIFMSLQVLHINRHSTAKYAPTLPGS